MVRRVVFLIAWLALLPARADAEADTVSVLSYNVHGLFRLAAADNPRNRMPTIGWLASRYDVVLLQEDGRRASVVELDMRRSEPGEISPDGLLRILRSPADPRSEDPGAA